MRVDLQRSLCMVPDLRVRVPRKVDVQVASPQELLVNQRTAGALSPYPCLFAKREAHLESGCNILSDTILQIEHVVEIAVEMIGPEMVTVRTIYQLRGQSHPVPGFPDASFQNITSAQQLADFADVL